MTLAIVIIAVIVSIVATIGNVSRAARENDHVKQFPFSTCAACGYDLTGSQGKCPECGRLQPFFTCTRCSRKIFGRPPGRCPFCDE